MDHVKAKELVAAAKKIARQVDSWMSLSNALYAPWNGLVTRAFPTDEERREFLRSPEYEEINQIMLRLMKRKGLYPRAANGRNGSRG
jgi:hypothetical protein